MRKKRKGALHLSMIAGLLLLMLVTAAPPHLALTQQIATATLDPSDAESIPQFVEPLVIPPVMRPDGRGGERGRAFTQYQIAARQFEQQVLPAGYPETTVWGYGRFGDPLPGQAAKSSFNWPGFTVEVRKDERVRVRWVNDLVDSQHTFLPHLLPVDPTLHWANPPGPRDSRPTFLTTPLPYTGPVPLVTHVHGAHVNSVSDGHPEAWYLPNARNIPEGFYEQGTHYGSVMPAPPGSAWFEYRNDQRATTLWYHDHALGITRLNVYAGLAGFWLIRDDVEDSLNLPGPAPRLDDRPGTKYYEIPIAIQDRSFNSDGSLFYPDSRADFGDFAGPFIPDTPVSPIWNPEFFGETIVVNGRTWPFLEVEPRLYRFRFLNGSNSRFLILDFEQVESRPELEFHQIGAEGGLLPNSPAVLTQLLMAPAERADVIVDFSGYQVGDEVILENLGPDEPFKGLNPDGSLSDGEGGTLPAANPATTGKVMKFKVVPFTGQGNQGQIPATLPPIVPLPTAVVTRDLTLNEEVFVPDDVPIAALLGTGADGPLEWADPITENPTFGAVEVWRLINLTEDAHPIHPHLVQFQVIDRIPFDAEAFLAAQEAYISGGKIGPPPDPLSFRTGDSIPPNPWETGRKDTIIANPGEITSFKAMFDIAGLFVWHCHILEHEDNEMMRNYRVGSTTAPVLMPMPNPEPDPAPSSAIEDMTAPRRR